MTNASLRRLAMAYGLGIAGSLAAGCLWIGCVGSAGLAQTCNAAPDKGTVRPVVSVARLRVPDKAWKHFQKAATAFNANREEEYKREAAKALEIAPSFPNVYLLKAVHEVSAGRYQAGIDDLVEARRLEPGILWSAVALAAAYNGLARFHDARLVLETLHSHEEDTWQARYELTRAMIGLNEVGEALHWSEAVLAAAPASCMDAHVLRANALMLAHRWREAEEQLTLYVGAKQPQRHYVDALRVLERIRSLAREQPVEQTAMATAEAP